MALIHRIVWIAVGALLSASPLWAQDRSAQVQDRSPRPAAPPVQEPVQPGVSAATPPAPLPQAAPARTPAVVPSLPRGTRQVGANMPFVTYEAEAAGNLTNGTVTRLGARPSSTNSTPEIEASGRAFVQLDAAGHFIEFRNVRKANAMILRHCIPDAAGGGGEERTLNMYVNGVFRQTLTLSSRYNWLYGPAANNGQSNNPADGAAHVYWDDTRFVIPGGVKAGDRIRFQKDAGNTATYYRIDLLDLETIPSPLPPPKAGTFLDITASPYNANGGDGLSDQTAISNCIAAAQSQGKTVWFPAGKFNQTARFTLSGVKVRGAGPWHTELWGNEVGTDFAGKIGFVLTGTGSQVQDMFISTTAYTTRSTQGGKPFTGTYGVTENWRVQNVWTTHTHVAFWMSGCDNGVIRDMRVYVTYADAININRGASHNLVVNNYVRGAGDDGIVSLSELQNGSVVNQIATNNTFRHNTVIANWWGHNAAIGGGGGHVYEYNYLADNSHTGVLSINLPNAFEKNALTSCLVRGNVLVRGGSNFSNQARGALWISASFTTAVATFNDNVILDSIYRGIHVTGDEVQHITFNRNLIDGTGDDGIQIETQAQGSGTFNNTTIRRVRAGYQAIDNDGGSDYIFTQSGTIVQ